LFAPKLEMSMAEELTFHSVSKRFVEGDSELTAVQRFDLQLQAGEFIAIVGPSGCGKSTLLRLIAGLDTPSNGSILIGDESVSKADPRCAIVFQEPRLFPWKRVAANIEVGARRLGAKPSTDRWLERVGLSDFSHCYPHQISGGMAQRVALARALIGSPQVLLMDEPFASLDALTRLRMQDLLVGVVSDAGSTVVMVTHDIEEALYLADRVVVMSKRPSTIVDIISVERQRPRDRNDPTLAALRPKILRYFGFESCTESAPVLAGTAAD
jgi:ABC-type nitrate/sulfonate/bicarbonate transport system ATPase subunit